MRFKIQTSSWRQAPGRTVASSINLQKLLPLHCAFAPDPLCTRPGQMASRWDQDGSNRRVGCSTAATGQWGGSPELTILPFFVFARLVEKTFGVRSALPRPLSSQIISGSQDVTVLERLRSHGKYTPPEFKRLGLAARGFGPTDRVWMGLMRKVLHLSFKADRVE